MVHNVLRNFTQALGGMDVSNVPFPVQEDAAAHHRPPPRKQRPCVFLFPGCVSSSRDNSLKFKTWELPQPGLYGTVITLAPERGREQHRHRPRGRAAALGTQTLCFSPTSKKQEGKTGEQMGYSSPQIPHQAKLSALKDDAASAK